MIRAFEEQRFQQLPEGQQHLLEFLSIIYAPISAQALSKLSPVAISVDHLRPLLNNLVDDGWLSINKFNHYACVAGVCDALTQRSLKAGRFHAWAQVVDIYVSPEQPKNWWAGQQIWPNVDAALRDLRLQVLLGDSKAVILLLERADKQFAAQEPYTPHPWFKLWGNPLDPAWLPLIPDATLLPLIAPVYLGLASVDMAYDATYLWEYCQQALRKNASYTATLWATFGDTYYWQLFLRGQSAPPLPDSAQANGFQVEGWYLLQAAQALTLDKREQAVVAYHSGLRQLRKRLASRKALFGNHLEVFYVLGLLIEGNDRALKEAYHYIKELAVQQPVYSILAYFAEAQLTGKSTHLPLLLEAYGELPLVLLLSALVAYWLGQTLPESWLNQLQTLHQRAAQAGYAWLAGEYAALLAELLPADNVAKTTYQAHSHTWQVQSGTKPLLTYYQPQPEWERSLQALQRLGSSVVLPAANTTKNAQERLVWIIEKVRTDEGEATYTVAPKLQKQTKGTWSDGRNVALKRLATEPDSLNCLTDEDKRVCQAITSYTYGPYDKNYELAIDDAWPHLLGHPRVFWADALNTPLTIGQGREELLILKEGNKLRIRLFPELPPAIEYEVDHYYVVEETTLQLRLYKLTAPLLQLHQILGHDGLLVPAEAEANVRQTLATLAPMIAIQSDIAGMDNAELVAADERLHIHLLPWGDGLRLLMRVQPLGAEGPAFPPGSGRGSVLAEINGKSLKTVRQLAQERQQAEQVLQLCDALSMWDDITDDLLLDEPEHCLEALEQLHALGDKVLLAWPEGEKLRLTSAIGPQNLALRVTQSGDWFSLDGQLQVSPELVLTLRQLLDLSRAAKGRFVPLGNGQFLSLTRQFQKRLATLRIYAQDDEQGLKIGALASLTLDDFLAELGDVQTDHQWQAQVAKLKRIRHTQPSVPSGLQAELRDYQLEGYRWMMRLAAWGVGGCLADDMGLGKTVQTLAMLLARGTQGAALVVAPVSVCNNWFSECQRFAPELRPIMYQGRERQQLLPSLQANDLLIASYGLIQQDIELFQTMRWSTIVLDEAQAIKNTNTKRTQAAYQLQGDFRLVTTGTPIENHLGELWSLFRFLNPGLLFSQQQFGERFMSSDGSLDLANNRQALRRLVQPFILRRTKNQVLQELPPRTEITLTIALSAEERALYEAIRQQALARFKPNDGMESKHLEVLAEITRLRLAACHPQLAMPGSGLTSSKLQAFGELILELRENQHKTLVFSQFVKHLELIRQWLNSQGIHYQYLDGSTTMEQRKERVDAFQRGEGDVFLISLKAGGFGLNLTAADYVIHMDPWWNPAVEDQASDRAHRIGQLRPVTIYRLVAENTIEEKIVKLHQQKRDLADSLLQGSDMSGKLSAKDMLEMIRDNGVG